MPSRNPARRFGDIVREIDLILEFSAGRSLEDVQSDQKTLRAIERCFQIISEAAIKLGAEAERLCPGHGRVGLRGVGNVLRHGYDDVELDILWETIVDGRLERMRADCARVVATLSS